MLLEELDKKPRLLKTKLLVELTDKDNHKEYAKGQKEKQTKG